jgi:hypothetical protein
MSYKHKDWTEEEIDKLCDLFDLYGEDAHIDATTLKNCKYKSSLDEKESEKDKKYKVVLAPSFPEEYRSEFEDILEDLEKKDNENKA